jgi:predicted metal-binding protein
MKTCGYCKGTKRARHKQPEGLSNEKWFELVGLGHCPMCNAFKASATMKMMPGGELEGVIFVALRDGKILASCPHPNCEEWAEVTPFFNPDPALRARSTATACPAGHGMVLEVTS